MSRPRGAETSSKGPLTARKGGPWQPKSCTRTKSGCRTCKTRKVKCDETFPICRRCHSTGRICDGYGIWGGGGRIEASPTHTQGVASSQAAQFARMAQNRTLPSLSLVDSTPEDRAQLDWFRKRTMNKLPGTYTSDFWSNLLMQASFNEPAVLHAILALSAYHQGVVTRAEPTHSQAELVQNASFELSTWTNISKAIAHLQLHFVTKDRKSLRIVFITCIVFTALDFMRGHLTTAQLHLENGLNLLKETSIGHRHHQHVAEDDWIWQTLQRLNIHVQLFRHLHGNSYREPAFSPCTLVASSSFTTTGDAWRGLDPLMSDMIKLANIAKTRVPRDLEDLATQQNALRARLANWYQTLTLPTGAGLYKPNPNLVDRRFIALEIFHQMMQIMTETCIVSDDETVYDAYNPQFASLLKSLVAIRAPAISFDRNPDPASHKNHSIVDLGWLPALFFVATKCRCSWLRHQALQLMESAHHREGMWDSDPTAIAARAIVEFEERNFYDRMRVDQDSKLYQWPYQLKQDAPYLKQQGAPYLPKEYRLRDVEVIMLGEPTDWISISCRHGDGDTCERLRFAEYHLKPEGWVRVAVTSNLAVAEAEPSLGVTGISANGRWISVGSLS